MIRTANMLPVAAPVTHRSTRNLAEQERLKDATLVAVGQARGVVPLKASRFAVVVGHSESHESRIRAGQRLSATGRAALAAYEAAEEEGVRLEEAGYCAAYIEVTIRSIAMWPSLEKLTTEELHTELKQEIARVETRANGICNDLDSEYLAGGAADIDAMLDAHTQQATASTRIAAILQVLAQRAG